MRRPRGPGGRFLTAEEVSLIEKGEGGDLQKYAPKDESDTSAPGKSSKAGTKRKSGAFDEDEAIPMSKKVKNDAPKRSTSAESEEPEDDDDADDDV